MMSTRIAAERACRQFWITDTVPVALQPSRQPLLAGLPGGGVGGARRRSLRLQRRSYTAGRYVPHLHKQAEQLSVLPLPELCEGFMADVVEPGMSATQMAAAQAEARQRHADRVAQLQRHVEQTSGVAAKRTLLLELLRLKSLRRPSLRVRRGLQAFAEHAQIHAGGGSFKELRLTLFIATHMEASGHCQQPQARFGAREPR